MSFSKMDASSPAGLVETCPPAAAAFSLQEGLKEQVWEIVHQLTATNFMEVAEDLLHLTKGMDWQTYTQALAEIATCIHMHAVRFPKHLVLYADICVVVHVAEQTRLMKEAAADRQLTFRRALLNACQRFFESRLASPVGSPLAGEQQKEAERKMKNQCIGNVLLIGELCKRGLLCAPLLSSVLQRLLWGPKPSVDYLPTPLEICMACALLENAEPLLRRERVAKRFFRRLMQLRAACESLPESSSEMRETGDAQIMVA